MVKVIGVRFRTAGKVYFFDPLDFEIKRGDNVIVETARGIEFGKVMGGVTEVEDDKVIQPLKPVIRIANQRDIEQEAANKEKEKEAFKICLEKIRKHELEKEQNLSLNPTKISGVCGRLMCCLKNEEETYEELNRRLPGIGDYVTTEDGLKGEVQSVNVLRQLVKVIVEAGDEKEIKEYPVDKLQFKRRHGKKDKVELSSEELQELERLEDEEQSESQQSEGQQERKPAQRYNDGQGNRGRQENRNRPEGGRGYRQDRNRGENRPESRGEGRFENRGENRPESRGESRFENRGENRPENGGKRYYERRGEDEQREQKNGGRNNRHNRHRNNNRPRQEGKFGQNDNQSEG